MFTKKNNQSTKNYFMDLARKQALYALGNTGKNPAVGCVVVKDSCIISAGRTSYNGRPHAEFNAIKESKKKDISNCDLYVTCLLYTSPSPRDKRQSRMPSSA